MGSHTRTILLLLMVLLAGARGNASPPPSLPVEAGGLVYVEVTQSHMGMPVHLRVYAPTPAEGRRACRAAFERVAELNLVLSSYEPESELSRLNAAAPDRPVPLSEGLYEVLAAAWRLAAQSDGLFDPTAAPLTRLWRRARAEAQLPTPEALQSALRHVGYDALRLDHDARIATWTRPGRALDLGAIAKGYVGDEALRVLRACGIDHAMFEAGGDMVFAEPPPGLAGWPVTPDHEDLPTLQLANAAAAISGDTVQFIQIEGRRYGHLLDPRTGQPVTARRLCLVVAPSGLTADPLATLGCLMPADRFRPLLAQLDPDARAWVVTLSDNARPPRTEQRP